MGLKDYSEIKQKVTEQMREQVKEIKTTTVEQWAEENGFENVNFANYDEAKEWVNENVNQNKEHKKNFYEFESEVDETLEEMMDKLENGSSSAFEKTVRHISKQYVSPAVEILVKSLATNLVTQGIGVGISAFTKSKSGASKKLLEEGVEKISKSLVKKGIDKIGDDEEKKKDEEIIEEELQSESEELKGNSIEEKVNKKRDVVLENVGRAEQMQYIVSEMKKMYENEGVNIPDIPEGCVSMEEYGETLRQSFKEQEVPKEKKDEIYAGLDVYKNNIGKMCKELKLGECGVIQKTKEFLDKGFEKVGKEVSDITSNASYTMKSFVQNALKSPITKQDIEQLPSLENLLGEKGYARA